MCIYLIPHKISEINGESILEEQSLTNLKKLTSILVVDDNEFSYLNALKKYEFNIVQKDDLNMLTDAEAFDVILCDIRGVGKFLESPYDGANLIKELKLKYPSKIIIAYTANDYDARFQEYLNYADKLIPKGTFSIEDWVSLLTQVLKESVDPVQQWKKHEKHYRKQEFQL
jgi:DNA-binding NarL/FixJ family response regulator